MEAYFFIKHVIYYLEIFNTLLFFYGSNLYRTVHNKQMEMILKNEINSPQFTFK